MESCTTASSPATAVLPSADDRRRHPRRGLHGRSARRELCPIRRPRSGQVGCSRPSERAAKVAESLGAELTTELDDVLRDSEVDAVDVCLPTPLHRDVTERAFAAEKHVFLEKPIALTLEDADGIIAAAERSGKLLMVGLVLRFWPEYVELGRRVAAGELGRPRAVSTHRLSPPADWNDWMADPEPVWRSPSRSARARLRPDEQAARHAAKRARARAPARTRARLGRVRRSGGSRGGEHANAAARTRSRAASASPVRAGRPTTSSGRRRLRTEATSAPSTRRPRACASI